MSGIKISAPGKLHLLGEHSVVYNKPAILAAVNKRCFVEIAFREDRKIKVSSRNYKKEKTARIEDLISKFAKAQKDWEAYNLNNDVSLLKSITKDPLDYPQIIIGQFLDYYRLKSIDGFNLIIDSEIPVGCGMGSSGALAVSIIGALSLFAAKPFDKKTINKIAFLCEQKKHGSPSGGDNSTSCFGGLVWFKKDEGIMPLDVSLPKEITKNFYIINTGTPLETTGEMVSFVRNQKEKFEKIFDEQELLVRNLVPALKQANHEEMILIIRRGEQNLESLGVVSPYVQKIIREIEKVGGAAKICGGGGKKKGTGIILSFHKNFPVLKIIAKSFGLYAEQIVLGTEGLRREI